VLYEITTGKRPFQGEHDPQVMASIMMGRYDPPGSVVQGYPHELSIIVMRALANDPQNRFASAEQMRQALEGYLQKSGSPLGTPQIAQLIRERCGAEMDARASAVRNEAAAPPRDPRDGRSTRPRSAAQDQISRAFDSGSGAMMVVDGRPAPGRRGILWIVAAAMLGAALGIGVLSYVRATRKAKTAVAAAELAAAASARSAAASASTGAARAPVPSGTLGAGANGAPATSASSAAATLAHGRVHLRITPPTAVVVIDNVMLPRGTDTITRPPDGATVNVLVRAEKFQDTIVMVDSATPDEVEVTLDPVVRMPSRDAGRGTRGATSASASPVIEAPPNPYE
jgi:serine/threonine-protein kinase